MIIVFTLTMPGRNTWNGRWSGQGHIYAIVKNMGKSQKSARRCQALMDGSPYGYDFGDGWRAKISVHEETVAESRKTRRASQGFCGYDWMVDSLLTYGNIKTPAQRREAS